MLTEGTLQVWLNERSLSGGDYPGLSSWDQMNHKGPCKREAGSLETAEKGVMKEAEFGMMHFADGVRGPWAQEF